MSPDPDWVRRTDVVLRPDPSRVVSRIFLPGQETSAGQSRSSDVLERVLALSEDEVDEALGAATRDFAHRHRDLAATWDEHFAMVEHRLPASAAVSTARRSLVGAYFTQEYAIEGAALCNPSMVEHPDQTGLPAGTTRFVLTLRGVGEGHVSSLELRTGTIDVHDVVTLDAAPRVAVRGTTRPGPYVRADLAHRLDDLGGDHADGDVVLAALPSRFDRADLDRALDALRDQRLTRGAVARTVERVESIAASTYTTSFPPGSAPAERVLMPAAPAESHGIEDVRMIRRSGADGPPRYAGTYTAFDGRAVTIQLLRTDDFATFTTTPLSGPGARDKGLALFPRRIGGRFAAMSRADREDNAVARSDDLVHWDAPVLVQRPRRGWELVQLGNCGPPIETEAGWVVLTHGVGPMRTYGIGALLLDLDDPTRVLGRLENPLLTPADDEREGYVPNVVYSCGAMRHGRTLVLPYGCSDRSTRIALVDLDALLGALLGPAMAAAAVTGTTTEER